MAPPLADSNPCPAADEVQVRELFEEENLDVLTMVETFLDPEQGIQLGGELVALCNERVGTKALGGTAILVRNGVVYTRLLSETFEKTELVVVKVMGTTVGALYSPSRVQWTGLRRALERFRELATGKALLLGDFNRRHVSWCTRTNP